MPPNNYNKTKPVKAIVIVITTLVVVLIVAIVIQLVPHHNQYGEETTITNLSEISGFTAQDKDLLMNQINNFIKSNTEPDLDISNSLANIRNGSINIDIDTPNEYAGSFIIDIPDLRQSYYVSFSLPRTEDADMSGAGFIISCPTISQIIYQDTKCQDYNTDTPENVSWIHLYQLEYTYGINTTFKITQALKKFIVNNYAASAKHDILVYIDETSLRKIPDQPGITYQLSATINELTATLIIQTDEGFGDRYIFAYMQDNSGQKYTAQLLSNDQSTVSSISSWAKNYFSAPDLQIEISEF